MNIYADRGNIAVLRRRLEWRGYQLSTTKVTIGEQLDPSRFDFYYIGGGQDCDQNLVAPDLVTKARALRQASEDGAVQLYVCGGIQLAGGGYQTNNGEWLDGIGVLDLETTAQQQRLTGDLVIETRITGDPLTVVGYENHAGRTVLGGDTEALGTVICGHGNNGDDGLEGATLNRVVATYLHGPLLPKNPKLADLLLGWALEHRYGKPTAMPPLDDSIELRANTAAIERAGSPR